jgi:thymidylate kinase
MADNEKSKPSIVGLRTQVANSLFEALDVAGVTCALQGDSDALNRWVNSTDLLKDLDIWSPIKERIAIKKLVEELGGVLIANTTDKNWLQHDIYFLPITDHFGIIDFTFGNLCVGPVSFCEEQDVLIDKNRDIPRLDGIALMSDLILRPMFRGRIPEDKRFKESIKLWKKLDEIPKEKWLATVKLILGSKITQKIDSCLTNGVQEYDKNILKRIRLKLLLKSMSSLKSLIALYRHRHSILRFPWFDYPLGQKNKGLIIALIGTDGAGKSTFSEQLTKQLTKLNYQVRSPYFGRARGNLPGINWLRETLEKNVIDSRQKSNKNHLFKSNKKELILKWLASWYYAIEYPIRSFLWAYLPMLSSKIVILDRYVYDLRIMPFSSKAAVYITEILSVKPDIIIFLHAPEEEILARKPERDLPTLKFHQSEYKKVIETVKCSTWIGTVSTSKESLVQPVDEILPIVLKSTHL